MIVTFSLLSILLGIYLWILRPLLKNRIHGGSIPGPNGSLVTGNSRQLGPLPHLTITEWARKYGGMFVVRLVTQQIVVLTDLDMINACLVQHASQTNGRRKSFRVKWHNDHHHGIVFSQPNENWHMARKAVHNCLQIHSKGGLQKTESVITSCGEELMDIFRSKTGKLFDPKSDLYDFTLEVISIFILGSEAKATEVGTKDIERAVFSFFAVGNEHAILDYAPWLRYFGHKSWKELQSISARCYKLFSDLKPDLVDTYYPEDIQCLMHSMMRDICGGVNMTSQHEKILRGVLVDMLLAGTTTTTNTMYTIMGVLAHYPHIQRLVRDEVDRLGDRRPTMTDKHQLHYTQALIMEVLRNASIGPMTLHTSTSKLHLWGYTFPKGQAFLANQWGVHHDPKFWEDPFIYKPERFLDNHGCLLPPDHVNRRHLVPFGFGQRLCLGDVFAKARLLLLTTMLVQTFKLLPEGKPDPAVLDPRQFLYGVIIQPSAFRLYLQERRNLSVSM